MRSTTTLTDSGWATGAAGTSLYGSGSGRNLPVPGKPNGRRRQTYKVIADRRCPSLGHLPGWRTPSPYPGPGTSFHPIEPIPNRLGVSNAETLTRPRDDWVQKKQKQTKTMMTRDTRTPDDFNYTFTRIHTTRLAFQTAQMTLTTKRYRNDENDANTT